MAGGTVLVTGATGFIGSHVLRALPPGSEAVGLASSVYPSSRDAVRLVRMTLPHPDLDELIARLRPAVVVHCAGVASVGLSMTSPGVDFQSGPPVVFQLYDAIRKAGTGTRVVQLSSAAVYGNPGALPVAEHAPLGPISPYGWHKRMCEDIAHEFHGLYGISSAVLRVFSCYGAGLRKQLLWDVGHKLRAGDAVFSGTGEETRDYVHVRDLARFIAHLVEAWPGPGVHVCNVGSGQETSVRVMVEHMAAGCGLGHVTPEFSGAARKGDPQNWRADIGRARRLGLELTVPLEDGVHEYARWFLEQVKGTARQ